MRKLMCALVLGLTTGGAHWALQLLHLHAKAVHLHEEPPHIKRRRGESGEAHSYRLTAMYQDRQASDREAFTAPKPLTANAAHPRSTTPAHPDCPRSTRSPAGAMPTHQSAAPPRRRTLRRLAGEGSGGGGGHIRVTRVPRALRQTGMYPANVRSPELTCFGYSASFDRSGENT
jgi:hypothetical protein